MRRNSTFRAERELIEKARRRAQRNHTSLNAEFRRWLQQYAETPHMATDIEKLMEKFRYVVPGRKYTRDEMNER